MALLVEQLSDQCFVRIFGVNANQTAFRRLHSPPGETQVAPSPDPPVTAQGFAGFKTTSSAPDVEHLRRVEAEEFRAPLHEPHGRGSRLRMPGASARLTRSRRAGSRSNSRSAFCLTTASRAPSAAWTS